MTFGSILVAISGEMFECYSPARRRRAFESLGASYAIFWQRRDGKFRIAAGYTTAARRAALRAEMTV